MEIINEYDIYIEFLISINILYLEVTLTGENFRAGGGFPVIIYQFTTCLYLDAINWVYKLYSQPDSDLQQMWSIYIYIYIYIYNINRCDQYQVNDKNITNIINW